MARLEEISTCHLLKELFGGLSLHDFASAHWGQTALHHHQLPSALAQALTREDFAQLLASPAPYRDRAVRTSIADGEHSTEQSEIIVAPAAAQHRFALGATLILQHAERYLAPWDPLPVLLRKLAEVTRTPPEDTQLAVFLSPPGSRAFPRHRDDNEVFTLQLSGSKCWRLYAIDPNFDRNAQMAVAPQTVTLNPGSFLYTPRNLVHTVESTEATSLSAALILKAPTWRTMLHIALDQLLAESGALAGSVPLGGFKCVPSEVITLVHCLSDPATLVRSLTLDTERLGIDRIGLLAPTELRKVALTTLHRVSAHWRLDDADDSVTLTAGGGVRAKFPRSLRALLEEIALYDGAFSADEIGYQYTPDTKARMLRSLLQKGLLRVRCRG